MKPLFCVAGVAAVLVLAGLVSGPAAATNDDETPSIKKIMAKLHGKKAALPSIKAALKSDSPNWEKVQKDAKIYAEYSALLAKNDPPRGDKADYDKLAESLASAGKSLEKAADKEELKGSRDALKKIGASCKPCHDSHKEQ